MKLLRLNKIFHLILFAATTYTADINKDDDVGNLQNVATKDMDAVVYHTSNHDSTDCSDSRQELPLSGVVRAKRGLTNEDADKVKSHFCFIKENLETDSGILDHFIQDDIFTEDDVELINSKPTRRQKVDCMLLIFLKSDSGAFPKFLDILTSTGNQYIREKLESDGDENKIGDCFIESKSL